MASATRYRRRVVNLQATGAAYWRALLMALWSLLNPTHPQ